jgi:hypothetical protein
VGLDVWVIMFLCEWERGVRVCALELMLQKCVQVMRCSPLSFSVQFVFRMLCSKRSGVFILLS